MSHKKPNRVVRDLYEKYIKGTVKGAIVSDITVVVCHLTKVGMNELGPKSAKVYLNTRVLKHMYDKRPAQEFDFLLDNLFSIVKYPDYIFANKPGKRGGKCFLKKMRGADYFVSFEVDVADGGGITIATSFALAEGYMKNYELLWSWEGRRPSS